MPWKPKVRSSQWADRNSSILEAAEVIKKQKHDLEQRRAEKEAFEKDKEQRLRLKSQAHSYEKLRVSRQVRAPKPNLTDSYFFVPQWVPQCALTLQNPRMASSPRWKIRITQRARIMTGATAPTSRTTFGTLTDASAMPM